MRSDSTANSGTPAAFSRTLLSNPSGAPSTAASISDSMSRSLSGVRSSRLPSSETASRRSSGRLKTSTRIGDRAAHSHRCAMKSNSPWSAHCRSSNSSTTGPRVARRSNRSRQDENSSPRSISSRPSSSPSSRLSARSTLPRTSGSAVASRSSTSACSLSWCDAAGSSGSMSARARTISASDANPAPWPKLSACPWCQSTVAASPSAYFLSSHARRDLPRPGSPMTDTSCRPEWESIIASMAPRSTVISPSRPTNGSSRSVRPTPPIAAITRNARHVWTGSVLPLTECSPASS